MLFERVIAHSSALERVAVWVWMPFERVIAHSSALERVAIGLGMPFKRIQAGLDARCGAEGPNN